VEDNFGRGYGSPEEEKEQEEQEREEKGEDGKEGKGGGRGEGKRLYNGRRQTMCVSV
jgi:hypothetical protein